MAPPATPAAASLYDAAIVWDNHACLPLRTDADGLPELERLRAAGITAVSINIGFAGMSFAEHLDIAAAMRRWFGARAETYRLVAGAADIEACKVDGRLGVMFDVEGMGPVLDDPARVRTLYDLGVRWMLIAYNRNNGAGGGCLDADGGLTALGRTIIDEMERVGMLLCLSHTGARTCAEAIAYARGPTIFSHSNPLGCADHPRNISDALIRACAAKGGVIGLNGFGPFMGRGGAIVDRFVDQIVYVADLVGAGHVGLGLDYVFDRAELEASIRLSPGLFPAGILDRGIEMVAPEALPTVADRLAARGFGDAAILGILGGNWLRVARRVWR